MFRRCTSSREIVVLLIMTLFLSSCALFEKKTKKMKKTVVHSPCDRIESDIDRRHLIIAAKVQAKRLIGYCFDNHLQFEKNKIKSIDTCTALKIRKNGSVTFVRATGNNGSQIPKDMKMCIEQELRIANFRKLKLKKSESISIAISFKSE